MQVGHQTGAAARAAVQRVGRAVNETRAGTDDVGRRKVITDREDLVRPEIELVVAEQRDVVRSEEHTSELQSLMRISYAVFCLKKKTLQTDECISEYYT